VNHTGEVHLFARADGDQFPPQAPALGDTVRLHLAAEPAAGETPPALTVRILHDEARTADAILVEAALETLRRQRGVSIDVSRASTPTTPSTDAAGEPDSPGASATAAGDGSDGIRALIWLGDSPVPGSADVVLEDRLPGPGSPVEVRVGDWPGLTFRARPAAREAGLARWRAVNGAPVLEEHGAGRQRRLVLLDRLGSPTGDDRANLRDALVHQAGFPETLYQLLLGDRALESGLSAVHADPSAAIARSVPWPTEGPARPLAPWLALAMALLFALERWLSERPRASRGPATGNDSP
jgi:hypothetical protein